MAYIVQQTEDFAKWLLLMKDTRAQLAIGRRIDRAEAGNLGDVKPISSGILEMRIDVGAGYRVYYTIRDRRIVFLLCGGDKSTQKGDIRKAIAMLKEI